MSNQSTITTKGQVVIPKNIRDIYGLSPQTKIIFEPMGAMIALKPVIAKNTNNSLEDKLAHFEGGAAIRSEWEKSLKHKLKKWRW